MLRRTPHRVAHSRCREQERRSAPREQPNYYYTAPPSSSPYSQNSSGRGEGVTLHTAPFVIVFARLAEQVLLGLHCSMPYNCRFWLCFRS